MPDYFVFGGCLRSELRFPELVETTGKQPDWILNVGKLPRNHRAEVISEAALSRNCRIRLTRRDGSFRYEHSCTGAFEVSPDGRQIVYEPAAGADLNTARTDFVARVLLYCVDRGGIAWLHGSAVRIVGTAVAFLGPSGAGKSTLALALARAGCAHVCDDTLPVEASATPMVWASDHVIRLRDDSRQLFAAEASAIRRESDGKFVLARNAVWANEPVANAAELGRERYPLGAVYILNQGGLGSSDLQTPSVKRILMPPRLAVAALMTHIKLGPLVRREDPAQIMQQVGAIARSVPVFELCVARDWSRVGEVVERIVSWHIDQNVDSPAPYATAISIPA